VKVDEEDLFLRGDIVDVVGVYVFEITTAQ